MFKLDEQFCQQSAAAHCNMDSVRTLTGCWPRLQSETGRMGQVGGGAWLRRATPPHWSETHRRRSHTPQSWTGSKSWSLKTPPAGPLSRKTQDEPKQMWDLAVYSWNWFKFSCFSFIIFTLTMCVHLNNIFAGNSLHQLRWISPNAPEQMPQEVRSGQKTVIAIEYDTLFTMEISFWVFDGVQFIRHNRIQVTGII